MQQSAAGKAAKIVLLAATLWPVIYVFLFFGFMVTMVISMPTGASAATGPGASFVGLFVVHMITILWIFGLMAYYVVNVFRNDRVTKDQKVLWLIVFVMGGFVAMPVYWYLFIWREPPPRAPFPD